MENKCHECADKREAAVSLIGMVASLVFNLPECGEFKPMYSEEAIQYEDASGVKYRLWAKADCYRSELRNDVEKDSRYVEIFMTSDNSGYMVSRAVLSGYKDMMIQKLRVETFPEQYEELIDKLIRDLRDV